MKKLLITILLIFITTICTSCNNDTYSNAVPTEIVAQTQGIEIAKQNVEEIKPTIVYITATGQKYHKENCQYLKYTKCRTFLEDAKDSGYTPCSICNP